MLRLFQSIFSGRDQGPYPEALVEAAIERAVDGTDPSICGVLGYRKKLKPAVLRSMDHVVALVDGLAEPIRADRSAFGRDARLKLFFVSAEHMQQVFARAPSLQTAHDKAPGSSGPICALLVMDHEEKKILGVERQGELILQDVPQVVVNFSNHRLLDPTPAEAETRRLLKRRAFDHLLGIALTLIAGLEDQRTGLERRRTLLQAKAEVLRRAHWGFTNPVSTETNDAQSLQQQINDIEAKLLSLGGDSDTLSTHLKLVVDVLSRPQEQLWAEQFPLIVDPMGIKRSQGMPDTAELALQQLHNARGRSAVAALVSFSL